MLCLLLWRWENYLQGWEGLIWISFTHTAVFAGGALFILWANWVMKISTRKRLLLNILAAVYVVLTYYFFAFTYSFAYGSKIMGIPNWVYRLLPTIPLWSFLLWLSGIKVLLSLVAIRVKWKHIVLAYLIIALGLITAPWLIPIFHLHHFGYNDFVHVVKTGALIPFVVISLGYIIITLRTQELTV